MKPIRLELISFGPYIHEVIDFKQLENKELFLITGDTGSGKSSIFDGICVALYGETSGKERSATSLRSDFKEAKSLMKVDFVFEVRGKVYHIIRVPKQMRLKQRGEGYTEEKGYVELYEIVDDEELLIDTDREVTAKITEIIGLDATQFRQIVMIPQGQFRKLITGSSEERERILKSIFDIYKYQLFQKKLEEQAIKNKKSIEEIKQMLNIEVSHIQSDDVLINQLMDEPFINYQKVITLTKEYLKSQETLMVQNVLDVKKEKQVLEACEKDIERIQKENELFQRLDKAMKEKERLEKKESEMDQIEQKLSKGRKASFLFSIERSLIECQSSINHQKEAEKQLLAEKEILNKESKKNKVEYAKLVCDEQKNRIEKARETVERLKLILPDIVKYNQGTQELKSIQAKYQLNEKALLKLNDDLKRLENEVRVYQQKNELHQKNRIQKERMTLKMNRLKGIELLVNALLSIINDGKTIHDEIKKYKDRLIKRETDFRDKEERYNRLNKQFIDGQAYHIRMTLEAGEPCPVCGSTVHIIEKDMTVDVPSEKSIHKAKEELDKLRLQIQKESSTLAVKENERSTMLDQFNEKYSQLLEDIIEGIEVTKNIEKVKEDVDLVIFETKESLVNIEKDIYRFNQYANDFKQHDQRINDKKVEIEKARLIFHKITEKRAQINETCQLLSQKILDEYKDEQKVINELNGYKKEIEEYQIQFNQLDAIIKENEKNDSRILGRINELKKNIEGLIQKNSELTSEFSQGLNQHGFSSIDDYKESKSSPERLEELENKINGFKKAFAIVQNEMKILLIQTKGIDKSDINSVLKQKEAILQRITILNKEHERLNIRYTKNEEQIKVVESALKKYNQSIEAYTLIDDLNKVAGGARGTKRITFERYILSAFLNDIIGAANARLLKMTNSRYQLVQKFESDDKRKHAGLDFEVFDYYTNKTRDIKTLSGGEGFKASLALALAVGDVAGSYSGGISIDTIFIDEGFGTLSSEYLDHAINCLLDLNEKGKLVGIISHVQELKERIDAQIIVNKSQTGSKVRIKV